jgi:hypothetical protein
VDSLFGDLLVAGALLLDGGGQPLYDVVLHNRGFVFEGRFYVIADFFGGEALLKAVKHI